MSLSKSGIPYLTHVWNVAVGCEHNCPGCWARERWAPRMECPLCRSYTPHIHPERFGDITAKQKPKVVGVGFFADLCGDWRWCFAEGNGSTYSMGAVLPVVASTIDTCPQHIFLSLTRCPDRLPDITYPDNWWWGTTITSEADMWRVDELLKAGTPHPWVSVEPMRGPVCLDLPSSIEWIVVGAESGPMRTPCLLEWVRDVVDQCFVANVPVWVKQIDIGGKCSHDMAEWPEDLRLHQAPEPVATILQANGKGVMTND